MECSEPLAQEPEVAGNAAYDVFDLRDHCELSGMLQSVYSDLLQVHFPIADELDDIEDIQKGLLACDGESPEMHVVVARRGGDLMGCAVYEYYPTGNFCLLSYICVVAAHRRQGVARRLMRSLDSSMRERSR